MTLEERVTRLEGELELTDKILEEMHKLISIHTNMIAAVAGKNPPRSEAEPGGTELGGNSEPPTDAVAGHLFNQRNKVL